MNRLLPLSLPIKDNCLFFLISLSNIEKYEVQEGKNLIGEVSLKRASQFTFEKDRNKFIIVQAILRHQLGKLLQCPISEVMILREDFGKPYIQDNRIYFNLSYSDQYAFLGFSPDCSIGVDIEPINKERALLDSHLLHATEKKAIKESENPLETFYDYWCAKEALLKAIGIGFTENMPPSLEQVAPNLFKSTDPEVLIHTYSINKQKVSICLYHLK